MNIAVAEKIAHEMGGIAIQCDVTDTKSTENAIQQVSTQQGAARICINCAGIVQSKRMVGKQGPLPLDDFRKILEVNLIGTFNVMRLAAAAMIPLTPMGESDERGI